MGVKLREADIQRLISLYKTAYRDTITEILTATTFGKIQRLAVLANIKEILNNLGVEANKWVEQEIPKYYRDGADTAVKQLQALGVELDKSVYFSQVQKDAIEALVSEVSLGFAESIKGVQRNAMRLMTTAQKLEINQIIAKGFITGDDRKAIAAQIKQMLRNDGLAALVDKSGKKWQLDSYTNMLVRTKAVEARNTGLGNRIAENGFDLVEVSYDGHPCELCQPWEGKILSYSGQTPGYPTYNDALEAGLFHPNCKHAINVLSPDLAAQTSAYDSRVGAYSGN